MSTRMSQALAYHAEYGDSIDELAAKNRSRAPRGPLGMEVYSGAPEGDESASGRSVREKSSPFARSHSPRTLASA